MNRHYPPSLRSNCGAPLRLLMPMADLRKRSMPVREQDCLRRMTPTAWRLKENRFAYWNKMLTAIRNYRKWWKGFFSGIRQRVAYRGGRERLLRIYSSARPKAAISTMGEATTFSLYMAMRGLKITFLSLSRKYID